jgi:glutathione synthase
VSPSGATPHVPEIAKEWPPARFDTAAGPTVRSARMRHAFIVDPLPALNVMGDTTILFMREAQRRGHEVWTGRVETLAVGEGGSPYMWLSRTALRDGDPWYATEPERPARLSEFDVVWMRKDPPYDLNYVWATHLLERAPASTRVINSPRGLRDVTEKLFVLRFPDLCPETLVSRRIDELLAFRDKLGGEMIVKPVPGAGGEGVFHLRADDRNVRAILEMATRHGTEYQIAQRYLPEIREGDKRIVVLDGEPIGAVMRVPQHWETRANFHVGGSPVRTALDERDREICARIGPALVEHGILFAGIDVIGEWLTEVNVTSPTGLVEINALEGTELERAVLDRVESTASPG